MAWYQFRPIYKKILDLHQPMAGISSIRCFLFEVKAHQTISVGNLVKSCLISDAVNHLYRNLTNCDITLSW